MSLAGTGVYGQLNNEDANIQYRFQDLEDVLDNLGDIINHHVTYQRPRLEVLDEYYKGNNLTIMNRKSRSNSSKADNRIPNPYASYISGFVQGYLTGIPVKVGADDEKLKELLVEVEEDSEVNHLNSELLLDLSKYGRAYELVFYREGYGDKSVILDVANTFVIYDTSVTAEELCGVHYRLISKEGNLGVSGDIKVEVTLYTEDDVIVLKETSLKEFEVEEDDDRTKAHSYGEVPIIEYREDRNRQGDYEKVIPLIDAYDSQVSDISNHMSDMVESLLVISGAVEGVDWENVLKRMEDKNVLTLGEGVSRDGTSRPVTAEYIFKQYDVAGTDSVFNRLKSDIHKHSKVPDMSDEQFSNNASGISMRYKLIGLEQLAGKKTRALERGFNKRYRLFVTSKEFTGEVTGIEDTKLTYKWTVNIPENIEDELKAFVDAGGELSQESLLSTLSFIASPEAEKKRLLSEKMGVTVEELNKLTAEELRELITLTRGSKLVNDEEAEEVLV